MSKRQRLVPVLLVVAALLASAPLLAGPLVGWERIGQATVSDRLDHDTIPVTARQGSFKAIQLKVSGHAVQFREVKIHFANGEAQNVELRNVIPAGGESRVIDVEGGDRVIRSIELVYDAQTRRGRRARVVIFGRN
jgi:hypothetical protein